MASGLAKRDRDREAATTPIAQEVRVNGSDGTVTPEVAAAAIKRVPRAAHSAALLALAGRGTPRGRPPAWAAGLGGIRFAGAVSDRQDMVLRFLCPPLRETAPQLYAQPDLWRALPDSGDTALDLLVGAVADVIAVARDSDAFDEGVLHRLAAFGPALGPDGGITLLGRHGQATVDAAAVQRARDLMHATPPAQRARVVGRLDMLRASTGAFELILDDDTRLAGNYAGDVRDLAGLLRTRVVVIGDLAYRPSGRPLRLDAHHLAPSNEDGALWSRLPEPLALHGVAADARQPPAGRAGFAGILGRWPGDETDAEVEAALARLS